MTKNYLPTTPKKVAFIGLGNMGFPMAGHLLRAGHDVTVYNRTTAKAEEWVERFGGHMALTPREAAADCDVVFTCVGNDDDLRSVVLGDDGIFAGMKPGAILFDCTTDSAMSLVNWLRLLKKRAFALSTARSQAVKPVQKTVS